MPQCPKCKTTRHNGLKHCHGCHFEFDDVESGKPVLVASVSDLALFLAMVISAGVAVFGALAAAVAVVGAVFGFEATSVEDVPGPLMLAFVGFVGAVVLWRVLNLSE